MTLFVLVLIAHDRRRIVHVNCTEHPTAAWTAQQLVEAFPENTVPGWLLRDRDSIYDQTVRRRIASLGITEVVSSPQSPWQNPYVERVIGSIRRECLNHVIIVNQRHLRRILRAYLAYYHRSRTHLALAKDAPDRRAASSAGPIVVTPEVGGLHHRYDRRAAEAGPARTTRHAEHRVSCVRRVVWRQKSKAGRRSTAFDGRFDLLEDSPDGPINAWTPFWRMTGREEEVVTGQILVVNRTVYIGG